MSSRNHRHRLSSYLSILILIGGSMLIIFGTGTSFASSSSTPPTPLYYVGYNGNDTVYMTSGISLGTTSLICFNNINSTKIQKNEFYHAYQNTSIGLCTGSNISVKSTQAGFHEYLNPTDSGNSEQIVVCVPVATVAHYHMLYYDCSLSLGKSYLGTETSMNVSGFTGDLAGLCLDSLPYTAGYNLCFGNTSNKFQDTANKTYETYLSEASRVASDIAYVAASAGCEEVAFDAATISLILSASEQILVDSTSLNSAHHIEANSCSQTEGIPIYCALPVKNVSDIYDSSTKSYNFSSVYSADTLMRLAIPEALWTENGNMTLSSTGFCCFEQTNKCLGNEQTTDSSVNLTIPLKPAFTIWGRTMGGKNAGAVAIPNQQILIRQKPETSTGKCIDYIVPSNSCGYYKFYAEPGFSYNVSLLDCPSLSYCLTSSQTDSTGYSAQHSFLLCPVSFTESGLGTGQSWSVDFNNEILSSTSSTITFGVPSGSYDYSVSVPDYTASPSSGTITVDSSSVTQDIEFTPAGSITFTASNVNGNTWSVTINGNTKQTSSSQIQFSSMAYGTYSYSIGVPSGYSGNPTSSTVTLESSTSSVEITFSPTSYYTVTFHEGGLPSGYSWSATMTGTTKSASAGSDISFTEPNGYFSYYFSDVLVPLPGDPGHYDEYYAPGGTAHVNGASQTIDVTYHYRIVFACVNGSTQILLSSGSYEQAQYVHAGTEIMAFNASTGSLQWETVQSVISVNQSGMYTINGNLQVSSDQQVLTNHGWVEAIRLHNGDMIFDPLNGTYFAITSIHLSHGTYRMYDFILEGNDNYVAYSYLLQGIST